MTLKNLDQEKFPEVVRQSIILDRTGKKSIEQALQEIQKEINSSCELNASVIEGISAHGYKEQVATLHCSRVHEEQPQNSYHVIKVIKGNKVGRNAHGVLPSTVQFYAISVMSEDDPVGEHWADVLLDFDLCDPGSNNPKNFCE